MTTNDALPVKFGAMVLVDAVRQIRDYVGGTFDAVLRVLIAEIDRCGEFGYWPGYEDFAAALIDAAARQGVHS